MQALAAGLEELLGVLTSLVTGLAFSQVRMFGVDIEWAVLWMAVPMLFFTVYLGFVNVRCFPLSIRHSPRALCGPGCAGRGQSVRGADHGPGRHCRTGEYRRRCNCNRHWRTWRSISG